jgi:beta-lactamase regulating signal transducer with metallopeptidase domain
MIYVLSNIADIDNLIPFLADTTAKATILLFTAWLVARVLRRSSAAGRHLLWASTLGSLALLPIVSALMPGWQFPILPPTKTPAEAEQTGQTQHSNPLVFTPVSHDEPAHSPIDPSGSSKTQPDPPLSALPLTRTNSPTIAPPPPTLSVMLTFLWITGFLTSILPTLLGVAASECQGRRAPLITDDSWIALLEQLRANLSIGRHIELRQTPHSLIPLTWGLLRPVVLLPEVARAWPESTRRSVLCHELAHIQRFDLLFQLTARLVTALYWFHPLAWYALRRLKFESEQACDDCVVRSGQSPADYAQRLVELARSLRSPRFEAAVQMARNSTLEQRITALFDDDRDHRSMSRRAARTLLVSTLLLMIVLTLVRLGPRQPDNNLAPNLRPSPRFPRPRLSPIQNRSPNPHPRIRTKLLQPFHRVQWPARTPFRRSIFRARPSTLPVTQFREPVSTSHRYAGILRGSRKPSLMPKGATSSTTYPSRSNPQIIQ